MSEESNRKPYFSIVITCYKVEDYIKDVIKSVQIQSFDDFEIIAVDDGSPDNCGKILDNLSLSDSRIKVIHQTNGGPGSARNTGLKYSNGIYLFFLDGDDRMVENVLSQVYELSRKNSLPDLIASNLHYYTNWDKSYIRESKLDRTDNSNLSLKTKIAKDTYLSHNFYLLTKIVENNRGFGEQKKLSEDQEWLLNNIHIMSSIVVYDGAFYYHYEKRPGSQVNGFSDDKIIPTVVTWAKMYRDIFNLNYTDKEKQELRHYTSSVFLSVLVGSRFKTNDLQIQNKCQQIFEDNLDIIKDPNNRLRIVGYFSYIIGVFNTMRLCNCYYRFRKK